MYRLLPLSENSSFSFLQKTVDTNFVVHLIIIENEYYFVVKELHQRLGIVESEIDRMCKIKGYHIFYVTNLLPQGSELINFIFNHNIVQNDQKTINNSLISFELIKLPSQKQALDNFFQSLALMKTKTFSTRKNRMIKSSIPWELSTAQTPFLLPDQIFVDFKTLQKTIKTICPRVLQNVLFKSTLIRMINKTQGPNHTTVHLLSALSYFYLHRLYDLCSILSSDYFLPELCSYINEHLFPKHKMLIIISKEHGHLISPLTDLDIPIEVSIKKYDNVPQSVQNFIGLNDEITCVPDSLYKLETFHHSYFPKNVMIQVNILE